MNELLSVEHQDLYTRALEALESAGIDFMLGGAMSMYYYTGWWRNTHDIDVYVVHEDVDSAVEALADAGFEDLGEQAAGDREWIYHAGQNAMIVDVIWRFANLANYVTVDWFQRAPQGKFLGRDTKFLPLEEAVWLKTFVINRHRCDWPDIMRVIQAQCQNLNWDRLLDLLGEHWLLLAGLVDVFDWQCPDSIECIPRHIRMEFIRRRKEYWEHPAKFEGGREQLLDPWINQRADIHAAWSNE